MKSITNIVKQKTTNLSLFYLNFLAFDDILIYEKSSQIHFSLLFLRYLSVHIFVGVASKKTKKSHIVIVVL
jgi:hypothetical protein